MPSFFRLMGVFAVLFLGFALGGCQSSINRVKGPGGEDSLFQTCTPQGVCTTISDPQRIRDKCEAMYRESRVNSVQIFNDCYRAGYFGAQPGGGGGYGYGGPQPLILGGGGLTTANVVPDLNQTQVPYGYGGNPPMSGPSPSGYVTFEQLDAAERRSAQTAAEERRQRLEPEEKVRKAQGKQAGK